VTCFLSLPSSSAVIPATCPPKPWRRRKAGIRLGRHKEFFHHENTKDTKKRRINTARIFILLSLLLLINPVRPGHAYTQCSYDDYQSLEDSFNSYDVVLLGKPQKSIEPIFYEVEIVELYKGPENLLKEKLPFQFLHWEHTQLYSELFIFGNIVEINQKIGKIIRSPKCGHSRPTVEAYKEWAKKREKKKVERNEKYKAVYGNDMVFWGKVSSVTHHESEKYPPLTSRIAFQIIEWFDGNDALATSSTIIVDVKNCGRVYREGEEHFIYAQVKDGIVTANCTSINVRNIITEEELRELSKSKTP